MSRLPLPDVDGEHSRAWWRALAIVLLRNETSAARLRRLRQTSRRNPCPPQKDHAMTRNNASST